MPASAANFRTLAAFVLAAGVAGLTFAAESDTTVTQSELPAPVAATVKEFGKGGEFVKAAKTDEDGVEVYEVVLKQGDKNLEVQTTLDGILNMREEKVDAAALPGDVQTAAAKLVPGGKIKGAELTLRTVYEVIVTDKKGKTHELLLTPGGQQLQAPEADEDEKGEAAEVKAEAGKRGAEKRAKAEKEKESDD